jgi:hypothetical protein
MTEKSNEITVIVRPNAAFDDPAVGVSSQRGSKNEARRLPSATLRGQS